MDTLPEQGIRHRSSRKILDVVQDLDAFSKVVDKAKEEKSATNGLISLICFAVILSLMAGHLYDYYFGDSKFYYKFALDYAYDESPKIDVDMIVATPCSNLDVSPLNKEHMLDMFLMENQLKKDPTRFELTEEEEKYWKVLQNANKKQEFNFKGLDSLTFVSNSVEKGLENAANLKQKEEAAAIMEQRKLKGHDGEPQGGSETFFMIGNGVGVFQIISTNTQQDDEGTACRIHGRVPVSKAKGDRLVVSIGKSVGIGGLFAHFEGNEGNSGNISHRIERLHFGERIPGLVTPLAGTEKFSMTGNDIYRYYLKIIPTRVFHSGLFSGSTLTYQYSVTFLKKESKPDEHAHGAIIIDFEFVPTVIEVRQDRTSFAQLLVRLCAIIGGVFATSSILTMCVGSATCIFKGAGNGEVENTAYTGQEFTPLVETRVS
uniref:COPIIcoated_ERV domain-containing protein n=1 Tax=Steinernema glaseri TaxID=37863 RepID=A0A1I7YN55_9BILA